jgi:uncharacterized protein (TIGR03435 family)
MRDVLKIVIAVTVFRSQTMITAAQNPPLAFEVASVKPSKVDDSSSGIKSGNGRIYGYNVTLKRCIIGAYGVRSRQIIGGPDWLDSDRFEIIAKAEEPVGDRVLSNMLQTLLADRFKLAFHREMKPMEACALEVKNNAPKLQKGEGKDVTYNNGYGHLVATNISIDGLAEVLSHDLDLPVVNRTRVDGVFNIDVVWNPDIANSTRSDDGTVFDEPAIARALQDQLGLRLRLQRIPVEVLVIDHAEKPSEN